MKEAIRSAVAKAKESLEVAHDLASKGHYDFAVSRSYYSMFYLAEAVLLARGRTFSSHKGVTPDSPDTWLRRASFPQSFTCS